MEYPIRINKYLAEKGLATRRGADTLIEDGVVLVNGKRAVVGQKITATDRVTVKDTAKKTYRYTLYHKPRGVITHSPGEHEVDIRMQIEHDHHITGLFPVGRLDKDSEGLILLTDDGRITKRLLEPQYEHEKEYHVAVNKRVTGTFLRALGKGVTIEGYTTKPAVTKPDSQNEMAFYITLTEGKKHQIRRMCAALGYEVTRLIRTRIGAFSLRPLRPGAYRELNSKERGKLLLSLGLEF